MHLLSESSFWIRKTGRGLFFGSGAGEGIGVWGQIVVEWKIFQGSAEWYAPHVLLVGKIRRSNGKCAFLDGVFPAAPVVYSRAFIRNEPFFFFFFIYEINALLLTYFRLFSFNDLTRRREFNLLKS